ncbi:MAG TPA: LemA family protein [Patescibacteria group bacterium]|nr:LemA family protein [Patescibacteria group bacterium]
MTALIVIGIIVLVVIIAGVAMYNGLVRLNVRTDEALSDITVQLKRRLDLIPNLVNTVKGYAKHEAEVLETVAKERAGAISGGGSIKETAAADNVLTGALKSVFAVAESNPDLKANQNFLQLQAELTDTEDKVQAARRFYNSSARDLNIKIKTFPTSIFAGMLGFKTREFYEVDEAEAAAVNKPVDVNF